MLSFLAVADTPNPEHLVAHALPWIIEAGNPGADALFGDAGTTRDRLREWVCRPSSEVSIRRVRFLLSDGEFAGGWIALSGDELRKARKADSIALLTSVAAPERAALALRVANLAHLMAPVGEDEYYLSRLGLAPLFRGKRLARTLVDRYIEEGARLGYSRYRLDVHADNEPAIRCYRAAGFEKASRGQSQDGALTYFSMTYEGTRL